MKRAVGNDLLTSRRCTAVLKAPADETGLLVLKSLFVEFEQIL